MKLRGQVLLVLSILLVFVFACTTRNPNAPAEVSGRVTYKGAPVTGGTLAFHSKGGGAYSCPIDPEGNYIGTDLPAGEVVVTIETESLNPSLKQEQYKGAKGKNMTSPTPKGFEQGAKGTYVKIPTKYNDPTKSPLKETLSRGKQSKNFDLTD
jgi:hypothetical protein